MAVENGKIYVNNHGSNTVSVIDAFTNKKETHDIPVGQNPYYLVAGNGKIYVNNHGSNTVSVNDASTNKKETHDIPVGLHPRFMAVGNGKIYVTNLDSSTVSVINDTTDKKQDDISVGSLPYRIAYDPATNMIYVGKENSMIFTGGILNETRGALSVIDAFSDKVVAGVRFNVNPANSGKVICNNIVYPTDIYLYVDAGTNCIAQHNKDFEFNT